MPSLSIFSSPIRTSRGGYNFDRNGKLPWTHRVFQLGGFLRGQAQQENLAALLQSTWILHRVDLFESISRAQFNIERKPVMTP